MCSSKDDMVSGSRYSGPLSYVTIISARLSKSHKRGDRLQFHNSSGGGGTWPVGSYNRGTTVL